jgi:hypothetical protein
MRVFPSLQLTQLLGVDGQDDSSDFAKTIINITTDAADLLVKLDPSQQGTADQAKADASDVNSNIDDFKDILDKVETARYGRSIKTTTALHSSFLESKGGDLNVRVYICYAGSRCSWSPSSSSSVSASRH